MSTYNGARYVTEQLHSILEQLPPEGRIEVRDDGSTDDTVHCIKAIDDPRIGLQCGTNLGFAASFLTLLRQVPKNADMVMFADQDDVWLPFKIGRAWRHLQSFCDIPVLYCSAQMLVDASLSPIQKTPPWPRSPSFAGAITENIVTGCTAALNASAVNLLQQASVPANVRFHDWWCYLVISAFGIVVFDEESTLLYRQHGSNHIGRGAGWWARQMRMARFLLRNDWVGSLLGQVLELRRCYDEQLSADQKQLLDRYFDVTSAGQLLPSWRLILSRQRMRQRWHDEIPFRVLALGKRLALSLRQDG